MKLLRFFFIAVAFFGTRNISAAENAAPSLCIASNRALRSLAGFYSHAIFCVDLDAEKGHLLSPCAKGKVIYNAHETSVEIKWFEGQESPSCLVLVRSKEMSFILIFYKGEWHAGVLRGACYECEHIASMAASSDIYVVVLPLGFMLSEAPPVSLDDYDRRLRGEAVRIFSQAEERHRRMASPRCVLEVFAAAIQLSDCEGPVFLVPGFDEEDPFSGACFHWLKNWFLPRVFPGKFFEPFLSQDDMEAGSVVSGEDASSSDAEVMSPKGKKKARTS